MMMSADILRVDGVVVVWGGVVTDISHLYSHDKIVILVFTPNTYQLFAAKTHIVYYFTTLLILCLSLNYAKGLS